MNNSSKDDRAERLAENLRANLRRRKAQARALRDGEKPAGDDGDNAGDKAEAPSE